MPKTYILPNARKPGAEVIMNVAHAFARGDVRSYGLVVRWGDNEEEQYWFVDKVEDYDMILLNIERLHNRIVAAKAEVEKKQAEG